jgi:hypothetical protein
MLGAQRYPHAACAKEPVRGESVCGQKQAEPLCRCEEEKPVRCGQSLRREESLRGEEMKAALAVVGAALAAG